MEDKEYGQYAEMEQLARKDVRLAFDEWLQMPCTYRYDNLIREMGVYQTRWMAGRPQR